MTNAPGRDEKAAGLEPLRAERPAAPVEQHDVDREAHAERVDRPAALQQQPFVGCKAGATQQSSRALAPRLRHEERPAVDL
jgi:hypothetical protein